MQSSDTKLQKDGIGCVGADLPIEVLLASGRSVGHLPWNDAATPWADQWLESSFPFWTRSILQRWYQGEFDDLAQVVFSRTDDASQRLYYYVRELQSRGRLSGPEPIIFDLALIDRDSSLRHSGAAVGALAQGLGVGEPALLTGVTQTNALRRRAQLLQSERQNDGPRYERLSRALLFGGNRVIASFLSKDGLMQDAASELDSRTDRPRLLLAGSVPVDDRLHRAVEDAGASIVAEAHVHALTRLGTPIENIGESPALTIARHLIAQCVGPRSFIKRGEWIVSAAGAAQADAVILWLTREEEALAWHVPAQQRALAAAGIATLILPAASWRMDDQALPKAQVFCRALAMKAAKP